MGSDEVRAAALRMQQMGDDVRRLADRALGAGAVDWRSTAATRFRERLAEEAVRARTAAVNCDDAAEALRHHARAVDAIVGQLGPGSWLGVGNWLSPGSWLGLDGRFGGHG